MNVIYIEHDEHDACSMIIYQYLYSTYIEQIKFYINKTKILFKNNFAREGLFVQVCLLLIVSICKNENEL